MTPDAGDAWPKSAPQNARRHNDTSSGDLTVPTLGSTLFTTMINEAAAEAQAMLGNVQAGVQTPHVLDDHTVDRILNLYTGPWSSSPCIKRNWSAGRVKRRIPRDAG